MALQVQSHSSHWGAFDAVTEAGKLIEIRSFAGDPDPSPLLGNIRTGAQGAARIAQPMVRRGWLEDGPGPDARRGSDEWVGVSWDEATTLLADEYRRVYGEFGPQAVYGGSYGWASAGRFHHAQSQLHRFLNALGGYVRSVNTYSNAAGDVILARVAGPMLGLLYRATEWPVIAEHTDLVVAFGGIPLKNSAVSPGGASVHVARTYLQQLAERGGQFELFSPLRDDLPAFTNATWHPIAPGTDVAAMLALAYVLIDEGLADRAFLAQATAGFPQLERYILGLDDGQPKDPAWAAAICEIPAETLANLARRMAGQRTLVNVSWSLQRAEFGEQPPWMGLALAAILGQLGLPGGGYGFGYGSMQNVGMPPLRHRLPVFPQGKNPVADFIPVARVSDMLLHPGETFAYDGEDRVYPEIKLVAWAGGNPFHHHQDLGRLRRALQQPDTVVVHDPFWTGTARHADVVLPSTVSLERNDIGAAGNDPYLIAMRQAVRPFACSRHDYDALGDIASECGAGEVFTENRCAEEWVPYLYNHWRDGLPDGRERFPEFDAFWETGYLRLPDTEEGIVMFSGLRAGGDAALPTPSGRIELYSETIASFNYADCLGHPAWYEPQEWLGSLARAQYPLQLVANNPRTRLHSQLDAGETSQASKIRGREPMRIHPQDAAPRGLQDGDIARLFNGRGSCLAGVIVSADVRPGVVQLSTGAWYDPLDPADPRSLCVHGNPNVLTFDRGTSSLAQGCSGQHALVEVERWVGEVPPIRAYDAPPAIPRQDVRARS
ncbi:MAG: molybdopterin-dependent oxidoreductase [Thermomicrobiales bacterium]|nr:molybdopterin-dependent oxidoreductase [Thermomicrobiales bacterium]